MAATSERFNAYGTNGRSCPICLRVGALKSEIARTDTLRCTGCAARFLVIEPGTLERIPETPFERRINEALAFTPADVLKPGPVADYREPVDMVCRICGAKHCHGHPQERGAGR